MTTPSHILCWGEQRGETPTPCMAPFIQRLRETGIPMTLSGELPKLLEASSDLTNSLLIRFEMTPLTADTPGVQDIPESLTLLANGLHQTATEMAQVLPYPKKLLAYSPLGLCLKSEKSQKAILEWTRPLQGETDPSDSTPFPLPWLESLGLSPVFVDHDPPGMILGRIWACLVNEAASALMDQVASPVDIDQAMRFGTNYPQGPLAWADTLGTQIPFAIMENLYRHYQEDRYRPMGLLRHKALARQRFHLQDRRSPVYIQ